MPNASARRQRHPPRSRLPARAEKTQETQTIQKTDVAALTPGPPPQADVNKSVQIELRRVGCLTGAADGEWNAASQRSLTLFNRNAGTRLDVKSASLDTLDAIKQKSSRVCPLVCEHGFRAEGDRCNKIVCGDGSFLNDDNECEKRRGKAPTAARERNDRRERSSRADRYDRDVPERARAGIQRPEAPGIATGVGFWFRPGRLRHQRLRSGRPGMPRRIQNHRARRAGRRRRRQCAGL